MKKQILCLYSVLAFLLFCSTEETRTFPNSYNIDFYQSKGDESAGILIIKFISNDLVSFKNIDLRVADKFPETQYEVKFMHLTGPLLIPVPNQRMKPTIHYPLHSRTFQNIESNKELKIKIKEGEYFLDLESKPVFSTPSEISKFIFQFGFASDRRTANGETSLYLGECRAVKNEMYYVNYSACSKIRIIKSKETYIKIYISNSKVLENSIYNYLPDYLFFGPYTYREMKVESINPEEQKSEARE